MLGTRKEKHVGIAQSRRRIHVAQGGPLQAFQGHEIGEVADVRKAQDGEVQQRGRRAAGAGKREGILLFQAHAVQPGQHPQDRDAGPGSDFPQARV